MSPVRVQYLDRCLFAVGPLTEEDFSEAATSKGPDQLIAADTGGRTGVGEGH